MYHPTLLLQATAFTLHHVRHSHHMQIPMSHPSPTCQSPFRKHVTRLLIYEFRKIITANGGARMESCMENPPAAKPLITWTTSSSIWAVGMTCKAPRTGCWFVTGWYTASIPVASISAKACTNATYPRIWASKSPAPTVVKRTLALRLGAHT